jgi:hypothetical protein
MSFFNEEHKMMGEISGLQDQHDRAESVASDRDIYQSNHYDSDAVDNIPVSILDDEEVIGIFVWYDSPWWPLRYDCFQSFLIV